MPLARHVTIGRAIVGTALLAGCAASTPAPRTDASPSPAASGAPPTRRAVVVDTLHGVALEDPYRWLESQTSPEVLAWIEAQHRYALQVLGAPGPARAEITARLRALMDQPQSSPPRRAGDWEYFTLRRAGEEAASIYRRRWSPNAGRVVPDSQYERVISPLEIRGDGTTSVAIDGFSRDGSLMMYSVRDGGPDEITVKIRDLTVGRDLPDSLPRALYGALAFAPHGRGFYYVHRSRVEGPRYRYHHLGTSPGSDSLLYGEGLPPTHFLGVTTAADGRYRIYTIGHGWARNEVRVHDTQSGNIVDVTQGLDAHFAPQVIDDELWLRTDLDAPRGRLVAAPLARPHRDAWRTVLAEGPDVLDAFTLIEGKLYVTYLRNASHRLAVFSKDGQPSGEVAVPAHSTVSIRGAGTGAAELTIASFTQPSVTYRLELATGARTVREASDVPFETAAFEVSQHWYRSTDGTRAPLWVVQKRGHVRSRTTPALLHGYGGFTVNLGPRFDPRAALWVERGGIFVQATLRGGNEFGEAWHKGGMLTNKQKVFDDFTSAAQFLVDSGFTAPERLAIRGGSNGGPPDGRRHHAAPRALPCRLCRRSRPGPRALSLVRDAQQRAGPPGVRRRAQARRVRGDPAALAVPERARGGALSGRDGTDGAQRHTRPAVAGPSLHRTAAGRHLVGPAGDPAARPAIRPRRGPADERNGAAGGTGNGVPPAPGGRDPVTRARRGIGDPVGSP